MKSTRLVPLVAGGALALSVLGGFTPAQADTSAGYVVGTVTDATGRALPGADVYVFWCDTVDNGDPADADGCFDTYTYASAETDRSGRYVAAVSNNGLADFAGDVGSWRVRAAKQSYTAPATSTPVAPAARTNITAPTIPLTLDAATPAPANTALTGLVTDGASPLAGAQVVAYDATGRAVDFAVTGADGRYYFTVSDPATDPTPADYPESNVTGAIRVYAYTADRVGEWTGGTQAKSDATPTAVPAYPAATPASAPTIALNTVRGTLSGAVKLPAAATNWEAYVTVMDLDGSYVTSALTDAAGAFTVDLAPGSYYVRADGSRYTEAPANDAGCATCTDQIDYRDFVAGYYGGGTSLLDAKVLKVGAGANASAGTITLTDALRAVEKPEVKGKLKNGKLAGKKLKATSGVWNRKSDVAYTYEWKVGKKTIGTGATLKLSKKVEKKIGKKLSKLTVTVTASDVFGELVDGSSKVKVKKALTKGDKDDKGKGGKGGKKG